MNNQVLELKHTIRVLPDGGIVLVLNTGAVIGPEAEAMLQALHSRSIGGISQHLKTLAEKGPEKFMSQFYVGYGHKSIGDCGTGTIFIEGVSMLVAKAVQDWQLYSGQECSTRFLDFSVQKFIDPIGTAGSADVLESWRSFYLKGLGVLIPHLENRFPRSENEKNAVYDKAIKARAFDIMRGFLPAGASTKLSWHSNLRQMADELMILRHHPLNEVKAVANALESVVLEAYPSSFSVKRHAETEIYNAKCVWDLNYLTADEWPDFQVAWDKIDRKLLSGYRAYLMGRPSKTELPKKIAECGLMQILCMLDFGSFRDIERHRAVIQQMPLLTTKFGFHPWYLSELPDKFVLEAAEFLKEQEQKIKRLKCNPATAQYYIAMGYNCPNRLTGGIHALVYLAELRSTRFVHPTLRMRALQIAGELNKRFKRYGLVLHLDKDPDRFDVKRGEQDIIVKD
ncbi:FAD-dependent thymidylate synthase [Candidatus Giovannonibacteria bacterium]|nr:FAD-dependent thymidylate synthase [Candidatus Giovannonibacteria bacterium]